MKDPPVKQHAPGTDPLVDWQHHFEPAPPRERWDQSPVGPDYPRKRGYDVHSPCMSELKLRRARVRAALEHALFDSRASPREKARIRAFLGKLAQIELQRPRTTSAGAMKSGNLALVWIQEPELAPPSSQDQPMIAVPWSAHFARI